MILLFFRCGLWSNPRCFDQSWGGRSGYVEIVKYKCYCTCILCYYLLFLFMYVISDIPDFPADGTIQKTIAPRNEILKKCTRGISCVLLDYNWQFHICDSVMTFSMHSRTWGFFFSHVFICKNLVAGGGGPKRFTQNRLAISCTVDNLL